jgi:peptidoglycan/LPS O-acetylase OafA/YrhL
MALQAMGVINSTSRNSTIDLFRAIAILGVVIFHFNNYLPYGYLGVDLFFVISGFLVSGLLVKPYHEDKKIRFWNFFLQRGFKIWPSYLAFLLLGNFVLYLIFKDSDPSQFMYFGELKKYILFYKNFSMEPVHMAFDQAWSLCVEEHFYIVFPIAIIILQRMQADKKLLFTLACMGIFGGIVFKLASFYFSNSGDTAFKTYNRMDGLAWGVLLHLVIHQGVKWMQAIRSIWFIVAGALFFILMMIVELNTSSLFFHKVVVLSVTPFCFFLLILGLYRYKLSVGSPLQFVAYYSYNWYLWHPFVLVLIQHYFGLSLSTFLLYLVGSFLVAMLFTVTVEEPFLQLRRRVMGKVKSGVKSSMPNELGEVMKTQ